MRFTSYTDFESSRGKHQNTSGKGPNYSVKKSV